MQLLAEGMRSQGAEPLVVVQPKSPLFRRLKIDGIAVASFTMRGAWDLLAVQRLRRLIGTWHPSIVHAHDPRSHSIALKALIGKRKKIPLVVTRRLSTSLWGSNRQHERVARFIAISASVRSALLQSGVSPESISLVYPGVASPPNARPREWQKECNWPPESCVVGVVGPLATTEGTNALERIVSAIPAEMASSLCFVLLGGPAGGRSMIGQFPAFRAGFVHDVHGAIAGVDFLIHPGTADGLGTAIIDGMALGIPSVAYSGGSAAEIVGNGLNGLLVAPSDHIAFADALVRMATDKNLRQKLANAGPERAREFTPERFVGDILEVYRSIMVSQIA